MIKFSFIIPAKELNDYIQELVLKILAFDRDDFEIILYPNKEAQKSWPKTRVLASGPLSPARKRNLAIKDAAGSILIFIDDDAYPQEDFLAVLAQDFQDEKILAVGGPAITPRESQFWQRVSGATFLSALSGGFPERYRPIGKKRFVSEWPTVNFSIRKNIFQEIGGFNCDYWPGEDSLLCFDLLTKKNIQVLYDPALIVYHHRREGLLKHILQISAYGLHRGYFAKKFPQSSLKWKFFMPSLLVLFIVVGALASFFSKTFFLLYLFGWGVYLVALLNSFYDIYKYEKSFLITLVASYYIFLTHLFYGIRFLQGFLLVRNLKSKLR